jgi:hypothetical protein
LRKISNIDIDVSVFNLFKYDYIADIYDENERIVDYPYLLYLCQGTEGSYSNLEKTENEEIFIPNKILHSAFGYCYLFTSKLYDEILLVFLIKLFIFFNKLELFDSKLEIFSGIKFLLFIFFEAITINY